MNAVLERGQDYGTEIYRDTDESTATAFPMGTRVPAGSATGYIFANRRANQTLQFSDAIYNSNSGVLRVMDGVGFIGNVAAPMMHVYYSAKPQAIVLQREFKPESKITGESRLLQVVMATIRQGGLRNDIEGIIAQNEPLRPIGKLVQDALLKLSVADALPDKVAKTADGSLVFIYRRGEHVSVLDFYPNGDIVLALKTTEGEDLYDVGADSISEAITLLKDALK